MNAKKTLNTQVLIDNLKSFNLSKVKRSFFINEHTSTPEHDGKIFVYKAAQALTFSLQYKGKANGAAVCTVSQFKSVPKTAPVNTVRFGINKENDQPVVYTQSLFAYNREFSVVAKLIKEPDLSVLKKAEADLVKDWIDFRLGNPVADRNHRLSVFSVNSLLQLAEQFLSYEVTVAKKAVVKKVDD